MRGVLADLSRKLKTLKQQKKLQLPGARLPESKEEKMENERTKESVAEMLREVERVPERIPEESGAKGKKSGADVGKAPEAEEKTEAAIQAEIVKGLRHIGFFCYSTPNEQTAKNAVHTAHLKAMGLYPGMADLTVWLGGGMVAYLEVKKPGGKLSKAQEHFQEWCRATGYSYYVVHSLKEAKKALAVALGKAAFFLNHGADSEN